MPKSGNPQITPQKNSHQKKSFMVVKFENGMETSAL